MSREFQNVVMESVFGEAVGETDSDQQLEQGMD